MEYKNSCQTCACADFIEIIHDASIDLVTYRISRQSALYSDIMNEADMLGFPTNYDTSDPHHVIGIIEIPDVMDTIASTDIVNELYPTLTLDNCRVQFIKLIQSEAMP